MKTITNDFYNEDCIAGCKKHIESDSIDLIVTDPPYGIAGHTLHKHYNRNEKFVLAGYVEVPQSEYFDFSLNWIKEAERILKPGGSMYIVSGYTNLIDILNSLKLTKLKEINHIIWKYNFGVYTSKKYVSSHYHILYYEKPGGKRAFNTFCSYGPNEKSEANGSMNYQDREDVWVINREYKPGEIKNKNQLPTELLKKLILYSSNEKDVVCDLFLGSFSTAKVAIGLNRYAKGFELNKNSFDYQLKQVAALKPGYLLPTLRQPSLDNNTNRGQAWTSEDKAKVIVEYLKLKATKMAKKNIIAALGKQFGRGKFSLQKILKKNILSKAQADQLSLLEEKTIKYSTKNARKRKGLKKLSQNLPIIS